MYAIIEDSGTQIKVAPGDTIRIDARELPEDAASITFDRVMMIGGQDDARAKVGQPLLAGATVTADVLKEGRGDKVLIVKHRRRKHYKKTQGHRQSFIDVKITEITG